MMLSVNADAKTTKSNKFGVLTGILYLSPADECSRIYPHIRKDVCPFASAGCRAGCLNTAGRGAFSNVQLARAKKTLLWHTDRAEFYRRLDAAVCRLERKAQRESMIPAARLDGTSDLFIARRYIGRPDLKLYDYTKSARRFRSFLKGEYPGYHLTFSRSETNELQCLRFLSGGGTVAAVFAGELPTEYKGFPVVNGDGHDARFLDPPAHWVGLTAKGRAKRDTTGFVIRGES